MHFLKKNNILLYHTENETKSAIVERVIRSIRDRLEPLMSEDEMTGKKKGWIKHLPAILNWYNREHIHRTTKMTPAEGSIGANQDKLKSRYDELRSVRLPDGKPLEVGQICRIYRWKSSVFAKSSETNWSKELFRIKEVLDTNPKTYRMEDEKGEQIKGSFYRSELLPSKFSL